MTYRFPSLLFGLACLAAVVAGGVWVSHGRPLPPPELAVGRNDDVARCAQCHAERCEEFATAPHFRTLRRADRPKELQPFADRPVVFPDGARVKYRFDGTALWAQAACRPEPLRVDWLFGSGRHARTPVSTWLDADGRTEVLEHRVSWYPSGDLGPTLGFAPAATVLQPPAPSGAASVRTDASDDAEPKPDAPDALQPAPDELDFAAQTASPSCLGTPLAFAEARGCFSCHSTRLPETDGRIDTARVVPGVRCGRCHFAADRHAAAAEQGESAPIERWADLDPAESVNRCGECHRRADQFPPDELRPDNLVLVRFAPVGLALSACFTATAEAEQPPHAEAVEPAAAAPEGTPATAPAPRRLDCTTCHDPHRPSSAEPEAYARQCRSCHAPQAKFAAECTSPQTAPNCLPCHMPKVPVHPRLQFTDHWIRVRSDGPSESR